MVRRNVRMDSRHSAGVCRASSHRGDSGRNDSTSTCTAERCMRRQSVTERKPAPHHHCITCASKATTGMAMHTRHPMGYRRRK